MYCKQKYLAPVYILTFRPRCQRMKFKTVQIPMFQTIFLYFTTLSRRIQDGTKQFASEKGRKKYNTISASDKAPDFIIKENCVLPSSNLLDRDE